MSGLAGLASEYAATDAKESGEFGKRRKGEGGREGGGWIVERRIGDVWLEGATAHSCPIK